MPTYTAKQTSRYPAPIKWVVERDGATVRSFGEPHSADKAERWASIATATSASAADQDRNAGGPLGPT